MGHALRIDTIEEAKNAVNAGFSKAQAEYYAARLAKQSADIIDAVQGQTVTKGDLEAVRQELGAKIEAITQNIKVWIVRRLFYTSLSLCAAIPTINIILDAVKKHYWG